MRTDVQRIYGSSSGVRPLARALLNPSIRAALLIRVALAGNTVIHALTRNILISLHSIDVGRGAEVGEGIYLPHPMGIVIGEGARIGKGVTIYHGVTIGKLREAYPTIEDNSTLFPNAVVIGNSIVSRKTRVAPNSVIRPHDVNS